MILREVNENDHEWLIELHNDPEVLKNLTNPSPITLESHLKWWNSLNREKEKRYIFCDNETRIGFCKIYQVDQVNKNCVLGADIHKQHRGKGFAKQMWQLMLQKCFDVGPKLQCSIKVRVCTCHVGAHGHHVSALHMPAYELFDSTGSQYVLLACNFGHDPRY